MNNASVVLLIKSMTKQEQAEAFRIRMLAKVPVPGLGKLTEVFTENILLGDGSYDPETEIFTLVTYEDGKKVRLRVTDKGFIKL
jgi:hypothetical protein